MDAFPSQHFMAVVNAQREMPAGRSSESWTSRCCCSYLEKSDSETAELQQHSSGLHLSSIIELWWILENGLLSAFTSQSSKDSWYVWNFSGYQTFLQCALPQRYWQNCLTKRSHCDPLEGYAQDEGKTLVAIRATPSQIVVSEEAKFKAFEPQLQYELL